MARTTSTLLSTMAVAVVLGLALVKGLSPFLEPDVWWHLHVGGVVRAHGDLTFRDHSASLAARPYVATQWLPEVIASAAYSVVGPGSVLWLRAAAIISLIVIVYAACRRYAARLPAALVAGLVLIGAGGGLNPRPQLVSFVLFAVTVHAWCGIAADRRPRWWLVPLFWLWACSHGLWVFGLAVSALMLLTITADPLTRPSRPELTRLSALFGACLVAVAVTPLGPALLITPFQVAGNASMIADEWRATPLNNVFSWAAMLEILACASVWALRPRGRAWWEVALLGFATVCTLWMWRLVPLGCIAGAPLLAGALQDLLGARRESFTSGERRALLACSALLLAVGAGVSATPGGQTHRLTQATWGPSTGRWTAYPMERWSWTTSASAAGSCRSIPT